jgi:hypothetical protein
LEHKDRAASMEDGKRAWRKRREMEMAPRGQKAGGRELRWMKRAWKLEERRTCLGEASKRARELAIMREKKGEMEAMRPTEMASGARAWKLEERRKCLDEASRMAGEKLQMEQKRRGGLGEASKRASEGAGKRARWIRLWKGFPMDKPVVWKKPARWRAWKYQRMWMERHA